MEIYISIDGVLRNFIQKFDYHYRNYFLDSEMIENEDEQTFDYRIDYPVKNDNILNYYTFQSKEEFENFCFIEFPLEIFGHAGISYPGIMTELNNLIYKNKHINFTVVGLDEFAKAKSSTLFFLSKNAFLGDNIKFIKSEDINKEWKKCDVWITDNEQIINKRPKNKISVKFITEYNEYLYDDIEINKLTQIDELCLKSWEKSTTSMLMRLLKSVARTTELKGLMKRKSHQKEKTEKIY